jgi:hypothetical protein
MKRKLFAAVYCLLMASLPGVAQDKLYPVRNNSDVSVLVNSERSAFTIDRAFQHKMTLGFPDDDRMSLLLEPQTPIVVLWLRVQNLSQRPLEMNPTKFSASDDEGRSYASLTAEEAFNKMAAEGSGDSLGAKTLRGISLGRVANKRSLEDVKEDVVRYSLHSGTLPPGGVREGFIFFQGPAKKKYRLAVTLGDLWSKPVTFSTDKR